MSTTPMILSQIPIVPGSIKFARCVQKPAKGYFFTIGDIFDVLYEPFCYDFGPPNFAQIYLFCQAIQEAMERYPNAFMCFCSTESPQEMTNALCLIGAYCIMVLDWSAEKTEAHFQDYYKYTIPYRDASSERHPSYGLDIKYCFHGLRKGKDHGWLDLKTFNHDEYTFYEKVENGDFNWIVPGKLLAVCSPNSKPPEDENLVSHPPAYYIKYFKEKGIDTIVRLNKVEYEAEDFSSVGITHHDMYFIDGTPPTLDIVNRFLQVAENAKGVAVHCKQGLGRTGTLLACYLMKHYGFSPAESIAFLRIQRPGSVVGPQQDFLHQIEEFVKKKEVVKSVPHHTQQSKSSPITRKRRNSGDNVVIPQKAAKIRRKSASLCEIEMSIEGPKAQC